MQCADLCMCDLICEKSEKLQKEDRDRGKENLEIYVYGYTQDNSMCFYKLE